MKIYIHGTSHGLAVYLFDKFKCSKSLTVYKHWKYW